MGYNAAPPVFLQHGTLAYDSLLVQRIQRNANLKMPLFCTHSVAQRVMLLRRGVGERSPRVRSAACAMLRHWLNDAYQGDASALLRGLDVESHEGTRHFRHSLNPIHT